MFDAINIWSAVAAAIAAMIIGMIWYGPLFGKPWMRLMGVSEQEAAEQKAKGMKGMAKPMIAGLISNFILVVGIAWVIGLAGTAGDLVASAAMGFWVWLFFIATSSLSNVLWEKKPLNLWIIDNGYSVVNAIVAALILGYWV